MEEREDYVYRGPKNKTGIFKNSLILKDLTDYQEMPDPINDTAADKAMNASITIDAGT